MNVGAAHRTTRVAVALIAGAFWAVPAGWLLAILALLPLFLGLFFNLVVGLLLGALVYRLARPAAPLPLPAAAALGVAMTLATWTAGLACEYLNTRGYDLPWYSAGAWRWVPVDGDVTRSARHFFRHKSLTGQEMAALRTQTRQGFAQNLSKHYPPGGFVGFLRWSAARRGSLEVPRVFSASSLTLDPKQRGATWLVRLALSLILLGFAVFSQVLGLARGTRPPAGARPLAPAPHPATAPPTDDPS